MNILNTYPMSITVGATGTATTFIGNSETLLLYVPNHASSFGSSPTEIRIRGAWSSGVTALTCSFYDYSNKTPAECVITITTAGMYEIPNAGGAPFVNIQCDKAATQATTCYLVNAKITY
jgi:hypothetical protein